jgi:hypothetical protein
MSLNCLVVTSCTPSAPEPPSPVPVTPLPPRVETPDPRDAPLPLVSGRFSYAPGTYRYEVVTESAIRDGGDSTEANVTTTTLMSLRLESLATDSLRATVTIDSVWAERDSLVPGPDTVAKDSVAPAIPMTFTTIVDAWGTIQSEGAAPRTECGVGDPLLAAARDLLVPVPRELVVGARWSDTATVSICRGGVLLTSGAVHDYEVLGSRRDSDGMPLMRLARTTTFTMAGTRTTEHRQIIALTGEGESRALLELDLRGGIVRSATREGTSDVTVTYGRTSTPFAQRVVQRVTLVRD